MEFKVKYKYKLDEWPKNGGNYTLYPKITSPEEIFLEQRSSWDLNSTHTIYYNFCFYKSKILHINNHLSIKEKPIYYICG